MFEINVMSGVRLSRHYFPRMLARNWGRVIFMSSEVGAFTPPDMVHYGVSKSAQLAVSRGMAELTKGTGVTVNSVLPSATRSDGIIDYLRQTAPKPGMTDQEIEAHFFQTYRPSSLIARMIEADEIAAMVALLASPLGEPLTELRYASRAARSAPFFDTGLRRRFLLSSPEHVCPNLPVLLRHCDGGIVLFRKLRQRGKSAAS